MTLNHLHRRQQKRLWRVCDCCRICLNYNFSYTAGKRAKNSVKGLFVQYLWERLNKLNAFFKMATRNAARKQPRTRQVISVDSHRRQMMELIPVWLICWCLIFLMVFISSSSGRSVTKSSGGSHSIGQVVVLLYGVDSSNYQTMLCSGFRAICCYGESMDGPVSATESKGRSNHCNPKSRENQAT